jgi:NADH-quinone oxidoreductase subunit C
MTTLLTGQLAADKITAQFPDAVIESNDQAAVIKSEYLITVADYLKNTPEMAFNYLTDLTSVDYLDYFEVVYRLTSLDHNQSLVIKIRCYDRENPEVPSITGIWKGANLMEREIFDLMDIRFTGHPNLTRIFMWEGFTGHPLRKDYL